MIVRSVAYRHPFHGGALHRYARGRCAGSPRPSGDRDFARFCAGRGERLHPAAIRRRTARSKMTRFCSNRRPSERSSGRRGRHLAFISGSRTMR
jgi:hypothetical protein